MYIDRYNNTWQGGRLKFQKEEQIYMQKDRYLCYKTSDKRKEGCY